MVVSEIFHPMITEKSIITLEFFQMHSPLRRQYPSDKPYHHMVLAILLGNFSKSQKSLILIQNETNDAKIRNLMNPNLGQVDDHCRMQETA